MGSHLALQVREPVEGCADAKCVLPRCVLRCERANAGWSVNPLDPPEMELGQNVVYPRLSRNSPAKGIYDGVQLYSHHVHIPYRL